MKADQLVPIVGFLCFSSLCLGQVLYKKEACIWGSLDASCTGGKVISIEEALFGRMRSTACITLEGGELPCFADVRLFAEKHCSGRRQCNIKGTNENLKHFEGNCTRYKEKYVEITYQCVDVYTGSDQSCTVNETLPVSSSSGYLASIVTDETGKGSAICPWQFNVHSGQTVHLTLLDFGVWTDVPERDRRDTCRIYATIKHIAVIPRTVDTLICGGMNREKFLLASATNIQIHMTKQITSRNDTVYFMIKYQVFNCPEFIAPVGAIAEQTATGYLFYCASNRDKIWTVRCDATRWEPQHDVSCPATPASTPEHEICGRSPVQESVEKTEKVPNGFRITCQGGQQTYEIYCVNGTWTPELNNVCASHGMHIGPTSEAPGTGYPQWIVFIVVGIGLVAIVVAVAAVIICRSRRQPSKRKKSARMMHVPLDNNHYFPPSDVPPSRARPCSDIYDTLDENRMEDSCSAPPLPGSSSSASCGTPGPRCAMTLPRGDASEPLSVCAAARRCGTLPFTRPQAEPHEYTTPLTRDSTYLVPREQNVKDPTHKYEYINKAKEAD